jgi:hypothetical protein
MDVKRPFRIAVAAVLIAILSTFSFSQTRQSRYDPATQQRSPKAPDVFLDFTLKRINPSDKNYGQCVDEGRAVLLQETVRNGYFWSNLIALGLLGCLLVIIIFQHRIGVRRAWAAAEILSQFEQSLQRSNAHVDEATKRNHGFKDALATLRESTLRSAPLPPDAAEITASSVAKSRSNAARVAGPTPAKTTSAKAAATERNAGTAIAVEPENQMALFKSDAALIMKVNSLEQQLARSEEQQKELRRQLNDAGRKLQAEQEKNRALKGA